MDIIKKILTLIILGMALQACKDCVPKPIKIPEEVGFSIYPERREYHVGDTIYFSSSTDENIFPTGYDLNSDEMVSKISVGQFFNYFSDSVYSSDAAKKFEAFILKGNEFPSQAHQLAVNIIGFKYAQEDNMFLTEVGVILKDTGAFTFIPGSGGIKTNIGERCEELSIFYLKYIGDNNNWILFDSLSNVSSTPDSRRNRYTFFVKPK